MRLKLLATAALIAMTSVAVADNFTFYGSGKRNSGWNGPQCDESRVIAKVQRRFNATESQYWEGLRMLAVDHVREGRFRDWEPTVIASRYCSATAELSDGRTHKLYHWIRSDLGIAGFGWGVQHCLIGRDRMMTYAPGCSVLRPK